MNRKVRNLLHKVAIAREVMKWRSVVGNRKIGWSTLGVGTQFGGFVYGGSTNLGDEFQTIAALECIPCRKVIPIEREKLSAFRSKSTVKVLMNGWFMHDPSAWPPSDSISPVFVGFHASKREMAHESLLAYYKKWEPIGCRDHHTVDMLSAKGVSAYFSGCPTLVLRPRCAERTEEILVVDAHLPNRDGHTSDTRQLLKRMVAKDVLDNCVYLSQNVASSYRYRHCAKLKMAQALLDRYARARLVITNRLHVALPCLAFSTPCVLLHERPQQDPRIASYLGSIHYASYDERSFSGDVRCLDAKPLPAFVSRLKVTIDQQLGIRK